MPMHAVIACAVNVCWSTVAILERYGRPCRPSPFVATVLLNRTLEDRDPMAKQSVPTRVSPRSRKAATRVEAPPPSRSFVTFSYQDIAYQIDLDKHKVYRRFIEIEKSK